MASIKMGAIVTDIKGKLGGHCFQKGNQSRVLKTNVVTKRVQSKWTRLLGSNITTVRTAWNGLSESERENWNITAVNFFFKNGFGDTLKYNGYQFFLKLNSNNLKSGQELALSASSLDFSIVQPELMNVAFDLNAGSMLFSSMVVPDQSRIQFYILKKTKGSLKVNASDFGYFWQNDVFPMASEEAYQLAVDKVGIINTSNSYYFGYKAVSLSGFQSSLTWLTIETL